MDMSMSEMWERGALMLRLATTPNPTFEELERMVESRSASMDELRYRLWWMWNLAELPTMDHSTDRWKAMFRQVGYFEKASLNEMIPIAAERPEKVRTLYRGATARTSRGMSWTPFARTAALHAAKSENRKVWMVENVPSAMLLARWNDTSAWYAETEYILDLPSDYPVTEFDASTSRISA